ncbi:MAG: tetratricopeptide repeat protein [Deltaproteobacteria bacterium]|nr:tetratricopeptide repeat protein [Deltaproteobacteria bacterium]
MLKKDMVLIHFRRNPFCCLPILFLAALLFLLSGCSTDRAAQKKKAATLADMGNAMAAEGNTRGGLKKLLEAARLDPDNEVIYQQIALVFRSLGDYPLSLKYFRKALELKPQFPEATNNMGTVYLLMGDWPKAIKCFREAAADMKYETPQYAYNNMGLAYFKMGNTQKAIENYEMALRLSRSYAAVYLNLARLYEKKGDLKEAEANYREAILYQPKDPAGHMGLAKLFIQQGKNKEAKEFLIKIIKDDPRGLEGREARKLLATLQN